MRFVVVTGTGTGVGKTVATAAFVAAALEQRRRVCVVKPYQTGVTSDEPSDVASVVALTGCLDVHELVRLDDPLAPETAARLRAIEIPTVQAIADEVVSCTRQADVTFVEGAGGVAVRLDTEGGTLISLAAALRSYGHDVDVVVVTGLGLGTLNHTALTVMALRAEAFEPHGLVFGDVVEPLGLAERCNVTDLPRITQVPVVASIPHGVGRLRREEFLAVASSWMLDGRLFDRSETDQR
jgi:dethiobiotin synthase